MDENTRAYLSDHHAAAMITLKPDGSPHAVRCGVALVDGRLWSSGTRTRRRTEHLRRDPRCTLFVFGAGPEDRYSYLSFDATATILDGEDAPELNRRLFTVMQEAMNPPEGQLFWNGAAVPFEQFLQAMRDEQRLIYQFEPIRSYGMP